MAMLQIGPVAFSVDGPSFDKLKSTAKGEWASQKRFARRNARQWTGYGDDDVVVSGTIYTEYFHGVGSLGTLRALMPYPQMLVSGAGDVFGLWCIEEVGHEQTYQDREGRPAKVSFDVKLGRYGEDAAGIAGGFLSLASSIMSGVPGMSIGLNMPAGIGIGIGGGGLTGGLSASIGPNGLSAGVDVGARVGPMSVAAGGRLF
jgi:phage protein U